MQSLLVSVSPLKGEACKVLAECSGASIFHVLVSRGYCRGFNALAFVCAHVLEHKSQFVSRQRTLLPCQALLLHCRLQGWHHALAYSTGA